MLACARRRKRKKARIETRLSPGGEWRKSAVLTRGESVVIGRAQFDGAPDAEDISRQQIELILLDDGVQAVSRSDSPSYLHVDGQPTRLFKGQTAALAYGQLISLSSSRRCQLRVVEECMRGDERAAKGGVRHSLLEELEDPGVRELHPAIARARAAAALRASAPQMPPSGSAQTPPSKQYCPPAHVPATPARSPYVGTPYRSATIARNAGSPVNASRATASYLFASAASSPPPLPRNDDAEKGASHDKDLAF